MHAHVTGPLARTELAQTFHNPYREPIEVEYLFPLPADAAVRDFVLTVGDRRIRGIVREREEARRIYVQARRQGYTASLLDEERPNLFRQHVANLAPRSDVEVQLTYVHLAAYQDGWHEYHLPLAVGERYFPAHVPDDLQTGSAPGTLRRYVAGGGDRDDAAADDERSGHIGRRNRPELTGGSDHRCRRAHRGHRVGAPSPRRGGLEG